MIKDSGEVNSEASIIGNLSVSLRQIELGAIEVDDELVGEGLTGLASVALAALIKMTEMIETPSSEDLDVN